MMEMVVKTGAIGRAKLQTNRHHQAPCSTITPNFFLHAGCPSCQPTNSIKALTEKKYHVHGLVHSKLTWGLPTLSLTIKGSYSCYLVASLLSAL